VWYGSRKPIDSRKKAHTLVIPVTAPQVGLDYANLRVLGGGRVLRDRDEEVHSWNRNRYNWTSSFAGLKNASDNTWGDGYLNATDTGNTLRFSADPLCQQRALYCERDYCFAAVAAQDDWGLMPGTNAGASGMSFQDYVLDTPIVDGAGAGQLHYQVNPRAVAHSFADSTFTVVWDRYFDNFSGGSITVKEIGIVAEISAASALRHILVTRDIVDDLAVADKAQLRIRYTMSLVYPGSGSPVRNYFNAMFSDLCSLAADGALFDDGYINITDTGGAIRQNPNNPIALRQNGDHDTGIWGLHASANDDDRGIRVGSDNTPVTFNDYNIGTRIDHGGAAGQLAYAANDVPTRSWAAPTMTITHARTFTNNSGGTVTVCESDAVARMYVSGTLFDVMLFHDVFSDVDVGNGETLEVIYPLAVAYPADRS
jgi:hypothetical protein